MKYLRVVYDAMTRSEEARLRAIEPEVIASLDDAGRTDRHYWTVQVREGVRYLSFGGKEPVLNVTAKSVLAMPAAKLAAAVRKAV